MIPISAKFMGVKISLINREELKEHLIQTLYDKGRFRVLFLDERKMFKSIFDKELRAVINACEIVISSSQTVAWMAKMFTGKEVPIIMPVTVFLDFMRVAEEMGYTLFLFGGHSRVNGETTRRMRKSFPTSRILGSYQSAVKPKEMDAVLTTIRKSSPQLFFASLGRGGKWEKWLTKNLEYYPSSVIVGLDDSFRVIAGRQKMPPLWFQKKNLNGLYTFLSRPYDLARIFRIVALFCITVYKKLARKN